MYCPQCGGIVSEGDSFCTRCGMYLTIEPLGTSQTYTEGFAVPDTARAEVLNPDTQGSSHKSSKKFLALLIVFILLAVVLFIPHSEGSLGGRSFSETAEVADDAVLGTYYCITPVSGFVDAEGNTIASIAFTDGSGARNGFRITLADGSVGSCSWDMKGLSLGYESKSDTSTDTSPTFSDFYGECTATVSYTNSSGTLVEKTLRFSVDLHRSYSWKYDGGYFSFDAVIDFDDTYDSSSKYSYLEPSKEIVKKQTMNSSSPLQWSNTPDFVVINDTVRSYTDTLGKLYSSAYGDKSLDQKYANFLLAYVQICYSYATDDVLYPPWEEYFAFPMQTIYYGAGDCEDTSILTAAIAGAAGFKTAVFLLPQHATVGIALDSYSSPKVSNGDILSQTVDGVTYYSGETTVNSFQELGIISYYTDSAGNRYHYSDYLGHYVPKYGTYGVYIVNTTDVIA